MTSSRRRFLLGTIALGGASITPGASRAAGAAALDQAAGVQSATTPPVANEQTPNALYIGATGDAGARMIRWAP